MALTFLNGSSLGSALQKLLLCDDIVPGSSPSYQMCKTIFAYHPLGARMAESPVKMAMSQQREITVQDGPDRVKDEFLKTWARMQINDVIFNGGRLARAYGVSSIIMVAEGVPAERPIRAKDLPDLKIAFNVLDPLNTAGSLVLDQNPNSLTFQRAQFVTSNGISYHPSRSCIILNEDPLYLEYTTSAYGFSGRSVYQRALYPLKSFLQTMIADDMVARKAGLLIAMMKAAGSIIDRAMAAVSAVKRNLLKLGATNDVLSIDEGEKIESLNLQNIDGALTTARKDILENVATAADMPAKLLNAETFAEGFGEGTEDAKHVARYIDGVREDLRPVYNFFDPIVQAIAWSPAFYKTIQREFPEEYGEVGYEEALYRWKNSFSAIWPSLLTEPESEQVRVDDVKLKAMIATIEVMVPLVDPENKVELVKWFVDNVNQNEHLFQSQLVIDFESLLDYLLNPPMQGDGNEGDGDEEGAEKMPKPAGPFSSKDSDVRPNPRVRAALDELTASVSRLPERRVARRREA